MKFIPWKVNVPEVLRKVPPQSQRARVRAMLRGWHLSMPGRGDVDRLACLVEATRPEFEGSPTYSALADESITDRQHEALNRLLEAAEDFREELLATIETLG
jgi:hypothetical protein